MEPTPDTNWQRVALCNKTELAEGTARGFDLEGNGRDALFVVVTAGQLHGYRNACPHIDGAPMAWRRHGYLNADGNRIVCFAHGAQFLPDTGLCIHGPCIGAHLQAVPLETDDATGHLFAWIKTEATLTAP